MTEIWQCLDRLKEHKSDQTFMSPASIKAWANTLLSVSSLHDARPTVDSENDNQRSYAKPVKSSLDVSPDDRSPTPNVRFPDVKTSCIQLTAMPQLAEALSARDDWTGTKDAAARRRTQTRLNMRAYRKRKAQERKAEALSDAVIKSEPLIECWDIKQESMSTISASRATQLYSKRTPVLPIRSRKTQFNFVFPLSPDHLITLLQYNALRALAVNRTLISGILTTPLDCDVETFHVVPYPTNPDSVPSTLLPTILQQTIPHGDWVDMFPCAEGRDNLIRAAGTFDEDELWDDCIGGLYEGYPDDEMERRGMIAWSPPWDISGWEMSEGFVRKWGWLFKGLPGPLEATNRWRIERGEEPFEDADLPSGTVFVGLSGQL